MDTFSRGVLFFAENNSKINYLKLAILSAICVKNNMGKETLISIVTNEFSLGWLSQEEQSLFESLFDKVIIIDNSLSDDENLRIYRDTRYHSISSQFLNKSRSSAYNLTPYDETLLIDVDYFVLNDQLNHMWGCNEDFVINKNAKTLQHQSLEGSEFRLNPYGIRMYWATLIYFKKSEKSKLIFDLVEHVKETWNYYKHVYDFPAGLYRNDYAFSIALHMLNGFVDDEGLVKSFPDKSILTAIDTDQLIGFENKKSICFFVNDQEETHKFYISKVKSVNVHCLNKLSILNKYENILKVITKND